MSDYDDYDYNDYNIEEDEIDENSTPLNSFSKMGENKINIMQDFELLKPADLDKKKEDIINQFIEYSQLSRDEAEIVLVNNQWNLELLSSKWFDNTQQIRINCGIERSKESISKTKNLPKHECLVCSEEDTGNNLIGLKCKHLFCLSCFQEYIENRLNNDPLTIVLLPCPCFNCNLIVTKSIVKKCLSSNEHLLEEYNKYSLKNFSEMNSDIKWCPNPKCGLIVRVPGHGMREINCLCGHVFCFKCLRESHRPCDCEMISIWENKNFSNEENLRWLLINTKQCPKCKKHIEKNQGCNHMICATKVGGCGHEFCWICLDVWSKHGSNYYKCNFTKENTITELDKKKKQEKINLDRYIGFFEKHMNHANSQKHALKLMDIIEEQKNKLVTDKKCPYPEVTFLKDAVLTIINCRRILKNTYVFGFFLKECKEVQLYEYNQQLLDLKTDLLHEIMEGKEIGSFLEIKNRMEFNNKFDKFRNKVMDLMSTIKDYSKRLMDDIENRMSNYVDEKKLFVKY